MINKYKNSGILINNKNKFKNLNSNLIKSLNNQVVNNKTYPQKIVFKQSFNSLNSLSLINYFYKHNSKNNIPLRSQKYAKQNLLFRFSQFSLKGAKVGNLKIFRNTLNKNKVRVKIK